jgi:hypothetical protein
MPRERKMKKISENIFDWKHTGNGEKYTLRSFIGDILQVLGLLLGFLNNKKETGRTYTTCGENKKCIKSSVGKELDVDAMIILKLISWK